MVRKILTQGISIFQDTFVEESILNLPFFLPPLRNGSTVISVNSMNEFKKELLPLIHLLENFIFKIFDPEGLKLFTRLRFGFSHLNKNRFRHNFQECLNALCTCDLETRNGSHYLLHCHYNIPFRIDLTNSVKTFVVDFQSLPGNKNVEITSISYIKKTKGFDSSLLPTTYYFNF